MHESHKTKTETVFLFIFFLINFYVDLYAELSEAIMYPKEKNKVDHISKPNKLIFIKHLDFDCYNK